MSLVVPIGELFSKEEGLLAKAGQWKRIELGNLVKIVNGYPLKSTLFNKQSGFPIIRIRDLKFNKPQTFTSEEFPEEYVVSNGDLLIGMDGDFICYKWSGGKAVLNQRVCKIIPTEEFLDPQFLFYAINGYLAAIHEVTSSVTVKHLSSLDILKIPFPLPPRQEQQRIVARLDELMKKIDRSRARLELIPKILKRFRQSILSAAVSGKLTEDWRSKNSVDKDAEFFLLDIQKNRQEALEAAIDLFKQKKGKKPKDVDDDFLPEYRADDVYPESWRVTRIRDVAECLDYIRKPINKDERSKRLGSVPYYGANGQVGWIDGHLFDEDLVVVVEDETFIGREIPFSYIIKGKTWVNNHAHVLRPLGGMSVEYLNACLAYYNFTPLTSGTTGRRKLNQGALMEAELAIAPLEEQSEIVRKIDQLFALADKIEARYNKAKAQTDRLPQSLLAKAFRGELVPQCENDEPAALFLEKIKAEKAKLPSKKTKGKEYVIEPFTTLNIAAESNGSYAKTRFINIPENKKAFAKQVLGGKIVSLFKDDPQFTHIKFQKLQYLAEHLAEVDLNWNYYRQSAGPYDPKFMHTVAFKLKASKWFEEKKYKFHPLEKADKIEGYYEGYFKPVTTKLDSLFSALKQSTEEEAEIVATLYAVWNNMIIKKEHINDDVIVSTFFEWSNRKKKYTQQQVVQALKWMKKNGFVPIGFGKLIKEKRN
jgi:type I restriction enzyme, S subunit